MAFSATEKISICKILGIDLLSLDAQLAWHEDNITSDVETAVNEEITRWENGVSTKFIGTDPNTRNFGAKYDPEREKNDVRMNIATLLFLKEELFGSGINNTEFEIMRG